ncbi:MAG: GNAT family N-acetyltransferase [Candidatus Margulisbacteria bacterium]|nr:GNAT family N-acetyltransferase [Candidatus Margulisiibacteriota bacterium]
MDNSLTHRKATLQDLPHIIFLLQDDNLGQTREWLFSALESSYTRAFNLIAKDPNHYLMVVERNQEILATCHLTLLPSLTFKGATRLQIEAVRVNANYRGQKIGNWMMSQVMQYAKELGVSTIQLTTNKSRLQAMKFYENLGFKASHEGMKLYL